MKKIISETLKNILVIIMLFIVFNFFREKSNITLYKLFDLEHIILIFFLSISKATYDYIKERNN
jgi:hypothetical protein